MKEEVYFEPVPTQDLYMNYCGNEICDPYFTTPLHIRQEHLIHYIIEGEVTYHTPHQDYIVKEGDLFLIYPGQFVHYEAMDGNKPLQFSWFSFSGQNVEKILKELGFSENMCVRHLHSRYSIHDLILQTIALQNTGMAYNTYLVTSKLYSILGQLLQSISSDMLTTIQPKNVVQGHVYRGISYIKHNYMSTITVNSVIQFVGLERTYFAKIFHQCTGTTIQNYLLKTRIEQAKPLLVDSFYSIKEISSFVGFQDQYYFSRAFKKMERCSPRVFRETCGMKNHIHEVKNPEGANK